MPNIAIVWDFDKTLTPDDSTTKVIEALNGKDQGSEFWRRVHLLRGDQALPKWEHVLAMDAPIWMYALSRLAFSKKVPLNAEFFRQFILPNIQLYPNALEFLEKIKAIATRHAFQKADIKICHFIVSAGLKDLIQQVFPTGLIDATFGCRYTVVVHDPAVKDETPESIPVFCMDETMKTRSLFEISKGAFCDHAVTVNSWLSDEDYWVPFSNMIYIGDSETDVPALSVVRSKGGVGVVVYNPADPVDKVQKRLGKLGLNKRADLITPANFSSNSELFKFIETRCVQIQQRYSAEKFCSNVQHTE